MIVTNASLITIAFCIVFLLLHRNIKINPVIRGISGVTLLSIVGVFSRNSHQYIEETYTIFNLTIAMIVVYVTYISYKRGFV